MKQIINPMRFAALMLLCISLLPNAFGQDYNKMYPYTTGIGNPVEVHSVDIIPVDVGNGYTVQLSTGVNNEIILTKLDFGGAVQWDELHDLTGASVTSLTPYKVIEKQSGELIVVGLATDAGGVVNPFAALFDNMGLFIDMRVYASNTGRMYNVPGFTRVNIVQMKGTAAESYIITAPSETPHTMLTYQDAAINAISIDGNTLIENWNKKYFEPAATRPTWAGPSGDLIIYHRDHPQGLVHVNVNNADKYVIMGTASEQRMPPGGPISYSFDYNFLLSVDNNGNIVNNYNGEYTFVYPFGHNLLWDQNTNEVVASFTIGNTNLASTATIGASATPASVIGVMKLNENTLTPVGLICDYYFFQNGVENYAYGIIENQAQDGYVIGNWYLDNSIFHANISILEIDKTTSGVNYYNRFNINAETYTAATAYNDQAGQVNYVVTGEKRTGPNTGDIRVASTDVTGNTCGVNPDPWGRGNVAVGSESTSFDEFDYNFSIQDVLNTPQATAVPDDCSLSVDPTRWRTTSVNNIAVDGNINVYPSMITGSNEPLTIEMNATNSTDLNISIFSIDGRKIAEKNQTIASGSNTIKWDIALPANGNYILKTTSSDATLNHTTKLSKVH